MKTFLFDSQHTQLLLLNCGGLLLNKIDQGLGLLYTWNNSQEKTD